VTGYTLITLVLCNVIWSAHPAMGKLVLRDLGPEHAAWARYTIALLFYFLFARAFPRFVPRGGAFVPLRGLRGSSLAWLVLLGFLTFCFSPLLQFTGLQASRSVDNALIIALEPLMAVVMAWILLGEALERRHWLSLGLAVIGFGFLSELTPDRLTRGWDSHLWGNVILLVSLSGEAAYSILGRKLVGEGKQRSGRFGAAQVLGSSLVAGVAILTAITWYRVGPPPLAGVSATAWLALLWLGVLGTTLGYFLWMNALKTATVASLSLTLFIQPVLGAVWGSVFLGERLGPSQWLGGALILAAMLIQYREAVGRSLSGFRSRRRSGRGSRLPER
jgi:drug/metabolite transporter (DMT)-like permease